MPKDTKTLGNNKARACESLGFVHKKRLCQRFDTTSSFYNNGYGSMKQNISDTGNGWMERRTLYVLFWYYFIHSTYI